MDTDRTAQLTFVLGGFLGQDVALERLTALDGTTRTYTKALFGAAFRFHFRHDTLCPFRDSSILYDCRWQQHRCSWMPAFTCYATARTAAFYLSAAKAANR